MTNNKKGQIMTMKSSTGKHSTGEYSTGDYSMGDYSTGDFSMGDYSTGKYSTGDYSTCYYSTGKCSTGDYSTGDYSTGHCSTGDWSISDYSTGHFSTIDYSGFGAFNKPCTPEEWDKAIKPRFLYFKLTEFVYVRYMSDEEKESNPTYKTTHGYLKVYDYKEAFQKAWDKAPQEDRDLLFKLPNFDAEVFKEISGIDVYADKKTCHDKFVTIRGVKYKLEEIK